MNNHDEQFGAALVHDEGQLAVDVIETPNEIIIRSAIAGVKPEDIDINVTTDLVTIRGSRTEKKKHRSATIHYSECFWGAFSRSVILPAHVQPSDAKAEFEHGVLTLTIPKVHDEMRVNIESRSYE